MISAQVTAKYARELKGEVPFDAESYGAVTGIKVDAQAHARLDATVRSVAARIGLDHRTGFAAETKYMGRYYEFAFLGMYHGQDREGGQPILVGIGLLARTFEDLDLLYRYHTEGRGIPEVLRPMIDDFLKLSEEQRIESILVHEKAELEAATWGSRSSSPHHTAVARAPHTEHEISPRVREHLALYARCNERFLGGGR